METRKAHPNVLEALAQSGDLKVFLEVLREEMGRPHVFSGIVSSGHYINQGTAHDSGEAEDERDYYEYEVHFPLKGEKLAELTVNESYGERDSAELYVLTDSSFLLARVKDVYKSDRETSDTDWSVTKFRSGRHRKFTKQFYFHADVAVSRKHLFKAMGVKDPLHKTPMQRAARWAMSLF